MIFDAGDRIRAKDSNNEGLIVSVDIIGNPNLGPVDTIYHLKWDHSPQRTISYKEIVVLGVWEKIGNPNALPKGQSGAPIDEWSGVQTLQLEEKVCNHQWKTYSGFTNSYDYCSKCDLKRNM